MRTGVPPRAAAAAAAAAVSCCSEGDRRWLTPRGGRPLPPGRVGLPLTLPASDRIELGGGGSPGGTPPACPRTLPPLPLGRVGECCCCCCCCPCRWCEVDLEGEWADLVGELLREEARDPGREPCRDPAERQEGRQQGVVRLLGSNSFNLAGRHRKRQAQRLDTERKELQSRWACLPLRALSSSLARLDGP